MIKPETIWALERWLEKIDAWDKTYRDQGHPLPTWCPFCGADPAEHGEGCEDIDIEERIAIARYIVAQVKKEFDERISYIEEHHPEDL